MRIERALEYSVHEVHASKRGGVATCTNKRRDNDRVIETMTQRQLQE